MLKKAETRPFAEYDPKGMQPIFALTELRGENSVSSSQPSICVPKRTHQQSIAELTDCHIAAEFSESSLLKQYHPATNLYMQLCFFFLFICVFF